MRADNEFYVDGVLRKRWDYPSRTYTEWDAARAVTFTRPYNAAEAVEADLIQASAAREAKAADARARFVSGIGGLTAALTAAQADVITAQNAQSAAAADQSTAATLRLQADTVAAKKSPSLADITALAQGLSSMAVWRGQVDQMLAGSCPSSSAAARSSDRPRTPPLAAA